MWRLLLVLVEEKRRNLPLAFDCLKIGSCLAWWSLTVQTAQGISNMKSNLFRRSWHFPKFSLLSLNYHETLGKDGEVVSCCSILREVDDVLRWYDEETDIISL